MEKLFNWIASLPRPVQILGVLALFVVMGYGFVRFAFGDKIAKKEAAETQNQSVILDFPDGAEDNKVIGKLEELKRSESEKHSDVNQYWESLASDDSQGDGGLMSSGSKTDTQDKEYYYKGQFLDPTVYSELERYYITHGIESKESIDRKHEELRQIDEENKREREERKKAHAENSDSAYFARMERVYQIAQKYTQEPDRTVEQEEALPTEPEPRKIEIQTPNTIPSTVFSSDDIITSLDSDTPVNSSGLDNKPNVSPAKATFLKNETLVNGQRVIMRLMQDLKLSDGTVIPSNTHINGICKISSRLKIEVNTINYGGRIYYTNLDVYDNDGTEGIYCPVIVMDQAEKSARKISKKAGNTAANILGTIASAANPYASNLTKSAMNEIVQSIDENGNVSVAVSSGYEFYMFEDIEEE